MLDHPVRRLRRKEASTYLEDTWGLTVAVASLAKYVSVGGGPKMQKFGRAVLYDPADLDTWAGEKLGPKAASSTELRALQRQVYAAP